MLRVVRWIAQNNLELRLEQQNKNANLGGGAGFVERGVS